jgi:hypothetical protein
MNKHDAAEAKHAHDVAAPKADADKSKDELIAELVDLRKTLGALEPPAQPYQEYPKVLKKLHVASPDAPPVVVDQVTVNSREEEDKLGAGWEGPDAKGHKAPKPAKPVKDDK